MDETFRDFRQAHSQGSGPLLSATLSPGETSADQGRLHRFYRSSSENSITHDIRAELSKDIGNGISLDRNEIIAWQGVYVAYWRASGEIVRTGTGSRGNSTLLYELWKDLANALIKGYTTGIFEAWTIPCLYVVGRYLRVLAIKADQLQPASKEIDFASEMQDDFASGMLKNEKLEDAARIINRVFTLCISDRAPLQESRRWGLYYTINLLFKTYFKLNSVGLSKNILRALQASRVDMPPMDSFPKSHIVTFKYYVGVILFLEENYEKAEEHLTESLNLCHRNAKRNQELILTYLIPCRLLTTHKLPSSKLLAPFPQLKRLFSGLCNCIKRGDLSGFDEALASGEDEFVKRRIYLTLERGRDITLRNLLRRVYLMGGFENQKDGSPPIRRSRVPVIEFAAAIRIGTNMRKTQIDRDEVECMLANMIFKNMMKGYISRERGIAVLSKGSAFPGTGV